MNLLIKQTLVSFAVGIIFAIGLGLAGMTQPQKVIGFLDPWNWNPALVFVMAGAVLVHAAAYPFIRSRGSPVLDSRWYVPTRKDLSARLIIGSAIFGIGWGLGGFCPGPGVTALASGDLRAVVFVAAMLIGMLLFIWTEQFLRMKR